MRNDLTELVFILDRSGSMRGLENNTIGGFNSMIDKQKREEGDALVSVVLFDDQREVLLDRMPLQEVGRMDERQYYVRGNTALLDALGSTIRHIIDVHKEIPAEDCPAKTLVIIITDGMENASTEYTYNRVLKMVRDAQKELHWEFLFCGADIDAISMAGEVGIPADHAVEFEHDPAGVDLSYEVLSKAVTGYRACDAESACVAEDWSADIRKDYQKRHRRRNR